MELGGIGRSGHHGGITGSGLKLEELVGAGPREWVSKLFSRALDRKAGL